MIAGKRMPRPAMSSLRKQCQWRQLVLVPFVSVSPGTLFAALFRLTPRLTPTPRPHDHAGCHECPPHGIGGDAEPVAELRQGHPAAVQLGRCRNVTVGQSLTMHLHAMFVQDLDDTALAQAIALSQLGSRGAVPVRLDQFIDRLRGQPSVDPVHLNQRFWGSDVDFPDFCVISTILRSCRPW